MNDVTQAEPPAKAKRGKDKADVERSVVVAAAAPGAKDVSVQAAPAPVIVDGSQGLMPAIIQLSRDPSVDVNKIQALLDMQRQMRADDAERAYHVAMNATQSEIMPVVRSVKNQQTNSKYARLEHVDAAIRPVYSKYGFSVSFGTEPAGDARVRIYCDVFHAEGHSKRYHMDAPPDTLGPKGSATKTELHGLGSTTTYLRRYLVCGAFNVVLTDEDDDGVIGGKKGLTQEQVDTLIGLIELSGSDEAKFLATMVSDAVKVEEVDPRDYSRLHRALTLKVQNRKPEASGAKLDDLERKIIEGKVAEAGVPNTPAPDAGVTDEPTKDAPDKARRRKWVNDRCLDILELNRDGLLALQRAGHFIERRNQLMEENPDLVKILDDALSARWKRLPGAPT